MCFEKRKTPAKILCGCSAFAAIFGILMIVFAFMLTNNAILEQMEKENPDIKDSKSLVFIILLIFSLATIAIASLGFLLRCIENRCFTCLYGIILLPTWIVLVVIGFVSLAASTASTDAIQDACVEQSGKTYSQNGSQIVISIDIYESLFVNSRMCSDYCPCKPTTYSGWDQNTLTMKAGSEIESYMDCIRIQADGDQARANAEATLSTSSDELMAFYVFANELYNQEGYDEISKWIKFFEDEYECAGICETATFYWSKPISAGRPDASCIESIKDDLTSAFQGLAITTLIAGIFLFFVFIMQYCLWRKY